MFDDLMNITAGQPQLTDEELQRLLEESMLSGIAPRPDGDTLLGRRTNGVNISDGFNSAGRQMFAAPTSSQPVGGPSFPFMSDRPAPANVLGYQGAFMGGSQGYSDDSAGRAWDARAAQNMGIYRTESDRAMQQQAMQNQNRMFDARLMNDNNLASMRIASDNAAREQQDRQFGERLGLDRQRIEMENQVRNDSLAQRGETESDRLLVQISKLPPGPMRDAAMARARQKAGMPMDQLVEAQVGPSIQPLTTPESVLSALPKLISSSTELPVLKQYLEKNKGVTNAMMEQRMDELRSRGILGDLFTYMTGIDKKGVGDLALPQQQEYNILRGMTGRQPVTDNAKRQDMLLEMEALKQQIGNVGIIGSITGEDSKLRARYLRLQQLLKE